MAKSIHDIANQLVNYCREGKYNECYSNLYADNCTSIEPDDSHWSIADGMAAVKKKRHQWTHSLLEFHNQEISDPICADGYFTCTMKYDATFKDKGRQQMNQICVYKVEDEKIIEERFFYPS